MHSTLVRLQNVFGFFTTVAFSVAAVIALSTFIHPQTPSATVELKNVQVVKGRPHYYSYKKEEYAHIKFDLDAGMSRLPAPTLQSRVDAVLMCDCRPQHALQLEHEASFPLPQSRIPVEQGQRARLRSHHLGRHSPRRLCALAPKPLHPPVAQIELQVQVGQEEQGQGKA